MYVELTNSGALHLQWVISLASVSNFVRGLGQGHYRHGVTCMYGRGDMHVYVWGHYGHGVTCMYGKIREVTWVG